MYFCLIPRRSESAGSSLGVVSKVPDGVILRINFAVSTTLLMTTRYALSVKRSALQDFLCLATGIDIFVLHPKCLM